MHRANDPTSGMEVAIKHICIAADSESDTRARALKHLQKEIELLREFSHPHIIRYLGTQRSSLELYIVMELVNGGSIAQLIARRSSGLPPPLALRYTRQILDGLAYLHGKGVIHRDIKGSNVLLARAKGSGDAGSGNDDDDAKVKIADFGSARLLQHGATLEEEVSTFSGTINWMAPEVIKGSTYGRRADVWSAGGTLLEMLSARPPWAALVDGKNQFALMYAIASSTDPPPLDEGLSDEVRLKTAPSAASIPTPVACDSRIPSPAAFTQLNHTPAASLHSLHRYVLCCSAALNATLRSGRRWRRCWPRSASSAAAASAARWCAKSRRRCPTRWPCSSTRSPPCAWTVQTARRPARRWSILDR